MCDIGKNVLSEKEYARALENKTILVTGATGMIGRNVVKVLLELNDIHNAGVQVIAHARNLQKASAIYTEEVHRADFELLIDDISELRVHKEVDYIIHTAGVTGGSRQHLEFPMRTISTALDGTKNILDIALTGKVKGVVLVSSLEVYGNTGTDKDYIYEDDGGYINPVCARSSYPESKRMCECMFASYAKQYGVPATVARLTASFGYGCSYKDNRVFAQFAKSIIEDKDIVLKSPGETVRNYCDVRDVAFALLTILLWGNPGEAYNVANMETVISIKDLASKFIELYPESNTALTFDLSEPVCKLGYNQTMRNVLSSHKLMQLGWQPKFGIEDMIHHLVDSMINSKNMQY